MEDISIPRERFEELIGASKKLDYEVNARTEAEKRLRETEAKLAEREKEIESSKVKLEGYQAKEKEMERAELLASVDKLVASGHVEPARKDAEVDHLAGLSLEDRKIRLEKLGKITPLFGEQTAASAPDEKTADDTTSEAIYQKAIALQKKVGISYEEASQRVMAEMEG